MDQDIQAQDELIEVKLSDKATAKIKELNGFEALQADDLASKPSQSIYFRALASVRSLAKNGGIDQFGSVKDVNRLAGRLSAGELDTLLIRYNEVFGADEVKEALKKGPDQA